VNNSPSPSPVHALVCACYCNGEGSGKSSERAYMNSEERGCEQGNVSGTVHTRTLWKGDFTKLIVDEYAPYQPGRPGPGKGWMFRVCADLLKRQSPQPLCWDICSHYLVHSSYFVFGFEQRRTFSASCWSTFNNNDIFNVKEDCLHSYLRAS
jgi:hypothetical protein